MEPWPCIALIVVLGIQLLVGGLTAGIEAIQKARARPPAVEAPAEPAPAEPAARPVEEASDRQAR